MKAIELKVEHLNSPIGLDVTNPRFFWKCENGIKQSAYQIVCKVNDKEVWNTNKVISSKNTYIEYNGEKLNRKDIVRYEIKLWDENDKEGEVSSSTFELGLLDGNINGKWISGNYKPKKNQRYPVDHFKKEFKLSKKIKKARLYVTARGCYQCIINDKVLEDFIMAPGSTDYRKRIQYQTYDVTNYLKDNNKFEVLLADGWYRGSIGCFGKTNVFGRQTSFILELDIELIDGSHTIISSDSSWNWSNDGPIRLSDYKDGEIVDANMSPTYNNKAIEVSNPKNVIICSSNNVYVNKQEVLSGKIITTPSGKKLIDFKQNIAGTIRFKVKANKGQIIHLYLGEKLDDNSEFTQENIQSHKPNKEFSNLEEIFLITNMTKLIHKEMVPTPKQEIIFTCSGDEDIYETKFAMFGFRYVLVESDININSIKFEAIAVYSSLEETGNFECSDNMINKLVTNTRWSMKNNYLDVPTDCPTRERLGWTGDAQVFFNTASFMTNVAPFFNKWLKDMNDNQFKNGKISAVVPYNGVSMLYDNTGSSVGWGDAAILIPYRYYLKYGDKKVLEDNYNMMRKYAMFMINNTGHKDKKLAKSDPYNKYIYEKGNQLGEWLEPSDLQDYHNGLGGKLVTQTETATAYLHLSMSIMAKISLLLGNNDDYKLFNEYSEGAKKAYNNLFIDNTKIDTLRQAKYVRPLAFNLVNENKKQEIVDGLVEAIIKRDYKIGTGFLSTPFVLKVLADNNKTDIAYKMLLNKECPSWLYPIIQGATTIWENWDGTEGSLNHYSLGSVCEFLYNSVTGINVNGENSFIIKPIPGEKLSYAKATYNSIYGKVTSSWERKKDKTIFNIEVPSNTTAKIILPNGNEFDVVAGNYQYII